LEIAKTGADDPKLSLAVDDRAFSGTNYVGQSRSLWAGRRG
jgi:hypothetical protein